LAKDTRIALRRAPSIKGMGLLAQIPQNEIVARADAEASNHDGVAGRVPWIGSGAQRLLGRFGWRATQPDLTAQTAMALSRDLGPGLNDGIKEGAAEPGFWRTAPLWDVASSLKIGGLLHDGRARNVAEAVEWHGGEANAARAAFRALPAPDKAALVAFVAGM